MHQLVIDDLTIEYQRAGYTVRPIDGLNLRAEPGSLVLLLGPSGCGKTTLLSCLAGLLTPAKGRITFGPTEITALKGSALTAYRRSGVGVVFQAFNLVPSLDAMANVAVPVRTAGASAHAAKIRAAELLERVGMSDRAHHRPGNLSGGQQQRVAIARALANDPPLVVADEPTAHLDYVQVESVLRILAGLTDGGRVVVVATHDDRLLPLASQVVELMPHGAPPTAAAPVSVTLVAGETLFREGDRGDLIYVVDSGTLDIVRHGSGGVETHLVSKVAGEYFGEMGPLFRLPRSATARARTESTVTGYSVGAFRALLGDRPLSELLSPAAGADTFVPGWAPPVADTSG